MDFGKHLQLSWILVKALNQVDQNCSQGASLWIDRGQHYLIDVFLCVV